MAKDKRETNGKPRFLPVGSPNPYWETLAIRGDRYGSEPAKIMMHNKRPPDARAMFAMNCIERWGLVSAATDGEDSAGRQKARLLAPAEVAQRACEVTEAAFAEFESRGWLLAIPSYQELVDTVKDQEDAND